MDIVDRYYQDAQTYLNDLPCFTEQIIRIVTGCLAKEQLALFSTTRWVFSTKQLPAPALHVIYQGSVCICHGNNFAALTSFVMLVRSLTGITTYLFSGTDGQWCVTYNVQSRCWTVQELVSGAHQK